MRLPRIFAGKESFEEKKFSDLIPGDEIEVEDGTRWLVAQLKDGERFLVGFGAQVQGQVMNPSEFDPEGSVAVVTRFWM